MISGHIGEVPGSDPKVASSKTRPTGLGFCPRALTFDPRHHANGLGPRANTSWHELGAPTLGRSVKSWDSSNRCMCYEPYEIRAVWVYGDIRGSYEHRLYGYTVNQPYRRERAGVYGYTPKLYTAATRYGLAAASGRRSSLPKFHDLAECGPRALAAQLRRRAPALRPVAVGRGPSRCALRAAPPAARCRAVRPEKDRDRA